MGGVAGRGRGGFDRDSSFNLVRLGKRRAEEVDFVASLHQFLDQIDRLGRTATGRWIKRFVSEKGDLHNANGASLEYSSLEIVAAREDFFSHGWTRINT